ncbi:MAG: pyruvate formate lyase family protein, partial [Holophaga sp.]|nr:pyruvate formate lyase family protein [Holophaga sp.]
MSERTERLRQESLAAVPSITGERAGIVTRFYRENFGKFSMPVLRAMNFRAIVEQKELWLGEGELIVGERGPRPKAVPTFPELTCHSVEDLEILDSRPLTRYRVDPSVIELYRREVIPYWKGRSMREQMFAQLPQEWLDAYEAGCFTEFMEQRAPGHTGADGKIYRKGMEDFKADIGAAIAGLDFAHDPEALDRREELQGMAISCDAVVHWAQRYAELAEARAAGADPARRAELLKIADVCRRVPRQAPRDFQEALQYYWFCHLAIVTELNGWDAYSPGHLDQHLWPFYQRGLADGSLTRDRAKELLQCFFIKFNNHTAPAKQGVTAAESGTFTDFANINLAGLLPDGSDGSNELTHLLLEIIEEMHLLQPSSNMQVSRKTPDVVVKHALKVIRQGYGFPSLFNADSVVEEQLRQGKTLEDAREGGCTGCVEVGAFGKEAYILTGYFNLMKMLELALHDGIDPRTGKRLGTRTGDPAGFKSCDDLFAAFEAQTRHLLDIKVRGNQLIERLFATRMPHTFLSVITDDCITRGKDYNAGGARYNNTFIQVVGIGSVTDSLSALKDVVFERGELTLPRFIQVLDSDFKGMEPLRQRTLNKTPKYGNDNDFADDLMTRTFAMLFSAIDGRPNTKGGAYRVEMLPTTCHVYFGEVCGASPDGRRRGLPLSEGISPVQGADRNGPTAVLRSAAKMDHVKTGGTLLN